VGAPIGTSPKVGVLILKQHWQKVTGYIKVDIELVETRSSISTKSKPDNN
jgi:hypothetical protein